MKGLNCSQLIRSSFSLLLIFHQRPLIAPSRQTFKLVGQLANAQMHVGKSQELVPIKWCDCMSTSMNFPRTRGKIDENVLFWSTLARGEINRHLLAYRFATERILIHI